MTNIQHFVLTEIVDFVPKVKSGKAENFLGVLKKYEILGICGLGLNRQKFYRTKNWDLPPESQVSAK